MAIKVRLSQKDPTTMSVRAIEQEKEKIGRLQSQINDALIADGLGHVRIQEFLKMDHPLAGPYGETFARQHRLTMELERRFGPDRIRRY